ncbi:hypothetical protein SLEP1_g2001 [Rubroshorea leprosula]|uniref:RING-type E3 ubiquitin transferase n=1 Tax=Rubroshorea leprosula TaxID=152421 RepID=A0AAV5HQ80_9ROSI|nr:hypothetical protein SLEP1_g2001 [Rubroshorea leprosula]
MASNYRFTMRQDLNDHHLQLHFSSAAFRLFHLDLSFLFVAPMDWNIAVHSLHKSLPCSCTLIFSDYFGPKIVHDLFSDMGSSEEFIQTVTPDVLCFARELYLDPMNVERKVLKIVIQVLVEMPPDDSIEEVDMVKFRPASESSIESLERLKLCQIVGNRMDHALPIKKRRRGNDVPGFTKECIICLEDFWSDEEVVRMPCKHFFHGDCIVRWLRKSHLCPLCRYPLPG